MKKLLLTLLFILTSTTLVAADEIDMLIKGAIDGLASRAVKSRMDLIVGDFNCSGSEKMAKLATSLKYRVSDQLTEHDNFTEIMEYDAADSARRSQRYTYGTIVGECILEGESASATLRLTVNHKVYERRITIPNAELLRLGVLTTKPKTVDELLGNKTDIATVQALIADGYIDAGKYAEAAKFYDFAGRGGLVRALNNLGILTLTGLGVKKDTEKAFTILYEAAEKGHTKAQKQVGDQYAKGEGTEQDFGKAEDMYSKAAKNGSASAAKEHSKLRLGIGGKIAQIKNGVLMGALGVKATSDEIMAVIIADKTALPAKEVGLFETLEDNQESVIIETFQGNAIYVKDNTPLDSFELSGIRVAPRGEVEVDIIFEIDKNGVLRITAKDVETGKEARSRAINTQFD